MPAASSSDFEVPANHNPATVRFLNFLDEGVVGIRYSASESAEIRSMVDNQETGSRFLGKLGQLQGRSMELFPLALKVGRGTS